MSSRTLVALVLAILLAAPAVALSVAPREDGLRLTTGSGDTVTIRRDTYGVPHVYADTAYALFWGNGYAQAQDRLFQMDVLRHVGKGDSARFLGPSQLPMDLETRRELYTDAERTARWNSLPEEQRNMFQGFADGVNAFILETQKDPLLLSAEFYAIAHTPEPWVGEDTIAVAEFLLDIFGAGSGGNELNNAKLLAHLRTTLGATEAAAAFDDVFPMHHPEAYTTIAASESTYTPTEWPLDVTTLSPTQEALIAAAAGATPFAAGETLDQTAEELFGFKFGSNAMVIGSSLSANGAPLLLGGPQMAYHNPTVPYEIALHGAGYDAVGMGVGGAPGVIIGRNQNLAWTVTSGSSDQVDVVAVKLVDGNPRRYYVSGTSGPEVDMDCRTEIHFGPPTAIDQNPPVLATQEVCRTNRGPVFAINEDAGYAFSRERTHRGDELRSGILWLTLAQNEDLASFQQHMDTFRFEFNFHVASTGGDIAYYHFGANPERDMTCDPRLPRLAGDCDWLDVRTGDDLPFIVNPASDKIVNWNNKPAMGWSGGDAAEKWGPANRAELIERALANELAKDGSLTIADLEAVNVYISTRSPYPFDLVDPLLAAASAAGLDTAPGTADAIAALVAWKADEFTWTPDDATCTTATAPDACFGTHSPGFTLYEAWRTALHERILRDELGPHVRELGFVPETSSDPHAADHGREDNKDNTIQSALAGTTGHAWCDDIATTTVETCDAHLAGALLDATTTLAAQYGPDVDDWRRDAHTIKFVGLSGGPAWRIPMVNRPTFNHWYDMGTGAGGSVMAPGTNQYWKGLDFIRFSADGTMPDAHKRDQLDLYVDFAWKPAHLTPPGGWESEQTFALGAGPLG